MKKYKSKHFQQSDRMVLASEIQEGMLLARKNYGEFFEVDEIEKEFINEEVSKLYSDEDLEIKPEHSLLTFYDERGNGIFGILGTDSFVCFSRVYGEDSPLEENEALRIALEFADAYIKTRSELELKKSDTQSISNEAIETGLFDLDAFMGYPISVVNEYFKGKGWQMVDCFNDYKWAWTRVDLNKSIIVKVDFVEDNFEVVNSITSIDGVYSEG
jgi:hypothetical protein